LYFPEHEHSVSSFEVIVPSVTLGVTSLPPRSRVLLAKIIVQEMHRLIWNRDVNYRVQPSLPVSLTLCQMNRRSLANLKITIFWDAPPCGLVDPYRRGAPSRKNMLLPSPVYRKSQKTVIVIVTAVRTSNLIPQTCQ
jgi:hypothetical protein